MHLRVLVSCKSTLQMAQIGHCVHTGIEAGAMVYVGLSHGIVARLHGRDWWSNGCLISNCTLYDSNMPSKCGPGNVACNMCKREWMSPHTQIELHPSK